MSWSSLVLYRKFKPKTSGFGLIELLVSISILVLVMTIVMANHRSFNGAIVLRSQAYEVALRIREVQLNAVSARGEAGDYRELQGLHFDDDENIYQVFKDSDGGSVSNRSTFDIQGVINSDFEIDQIRLGGTSVDNVSIAFQRPNFDAKFYNTSNTENTVADSVEIDIARVGASGSGCGDVRTIEITRTGQITVLDC